MSAGDQQRAPAGPLAGIRVLELGSFIAGPFAGQLLGDYGAEVLKVEPPDSGDPMRRWGITCDGESLWWPALARNKRSVSLDLRDVTQREVLVELIAQCDIVVENFRPGRLAEWGLSYEALKKRNPRLILVHVSGFGQDGPRSTAAGFGSIGEAVGGIRHTTGEPDRPSSRAGISLGDSLAALFAVIGALAALAERHESGCGQEVDVAIYEAVAALMESSMADYAIGGVLRQRTGSILPGVAPSNAYPTADGAELLIAANADAVFRRLCEVMGRPELAEDERYATHGSRGDHQAELDDLVAAWTVEHDAADLQRLLDAHGVPAGRIFTAADMLSDEHYAARGMVEHHVDHRGQDIPMTGIVPKFGRTPGSIRHLGPSLGHDTRSVLADLGISWTEPSPSDHPEPTQGDRRAQTS